MKLELRERTEAHVRIYFGKTQDPDIRKVLPQAAATVEQALENYRKTLLPGAASFGRTIYADGEYVGDIWCYCIDPEERPNAMLSYCIFEKKCWGQGIGTAALRVFLAEIASRYPLKSVGAFTYSDNLPSIRVLLKNGFAEVEEFEESGILSKYFERDMEN